MFVLVGNPRALALPRLLLVSGKRTSCLVLSLGDGFGRGALLPPSRLLLLRGCGFPLQSLGVRHRPFDVNLEIVVERLPRRRQLRVGHVQRRGQQPSGSFPLLLDSDRQRQVLLQRCRASLQSLELVAQAVQELTPRLDAVLQGPLASLELLLELAQLLPLRQLVRQPLQHHRVRIVARLLPLPGRLSLEFSHRAQTDRLVVVRAPKVLARPDLLLDVALLVQHVL
mmetsp:Transcript_1873/g.7511  ORF Transcript_1873/g.7511 Transcript_1873/m.7511 type:complete len:226 (+) Transcript_1873:1336-2013(+)